MTPPLSAMPGETGLIRRLALGFGVLGGGFLATTALQIVLVPVFLAAWGAERYADWLVLQAAAALVVLADPGLHGQAVALRLAAARGDAAGFQRVLSTGLGAYALLSVGLGTLFGLLVMTDAAALVGVATDDGSALLLLSLSGVAMMPRGLVASVYFARGEFGRETGTHLVAVLGQMAAAGGAAFAGSGLTGAAAAHVVATVLLGWLPLVLDIRRRHPDVSLRPALPRRGDLAEMGTRAPLYALIQGATTVLPHAPVLLLGGLGAPPEAVVAFTTMRTFTGLARQPASQLSSIAGIEMARQLVQGDRAGLRRLHAGVGRMMGALTGLLGGLLAVLGPSFFVVWTHGAVVFDPVLAGVFLVTVVLLAPGYGGMSLLRHGDRPRPLALALVAQAILVAGLCVLLIPPAGGWGAAVGAALAVGLAELMTFGLGLGVVAGRVVGEPPVRHAAVALAALLPGALVGAGAALMVERLVPVGGLAGVLAFTASWAVLVAPAAPFLLLDAGQRGWLRDRLMAWRVR